MLNKRLLQHPEIKFLDIDKFCTNTGRDEVLVQITDKDGDMVYVDLLHLESVIYAFNTHRDALEAL